MLKKLFSPIFTGSSLTIYATLLIILMGICWLPLEGRGGLGIVKIGCMVSAVVVFLFFGGFEISKATIIGFFYLAWQFTVALLHPLTFRWSTLLFSAGLVTTYICFYNLLYYRNIFTINHFISLSKWMMMAFFIVCIIQQCFIAIGISYLPAINLIQILNRGIGCNSLSMEPSTFARTMLVFYYAYVKCNEYIRDEGPYTIKELFQNEHKWVTIRFLWMMCTMGSGTAFVCLIAIALYFVRKNNWFYIIPTFLIIYFYVLPQFGGEQLSRATTTINATTSLNQRTIEEADGSAASRISPYINSLNADFSKYETWFGHGIDYSRNHNLFIRQKGTLFDDYGFIFYIIALIFDFTCAYRFFSLGCVFMFMGLAGGAGGNIHYGWWLMMVMTCTRYFYENKDYLELNNDCDS